jgi:hypothetical protein
VAVTALANHRLAVRFIDGVHGEVDLWRLIHADGAGVFRRLREPSAFAEVRIDAGAVSWPGDLDLAPDAMYDAIRSGGLWAPDIISTG